MGPIRLVLASASPRRRALLTRLGIPFHVDAADVDETPGPAEPPATLARRLVASKARAVAPRWPGALILTADTLVVLAGEPLGKPADATAAREMLRRLRVRPHEVLTVVCLRRPDRPPLLTSARTRAEMRPYSDDEVATYVASGAPLDKAGAYGIQDAAFRPVARLAGCYTNVVGLPLCRVVALLQASEVPLGVDAASVCPHEPGWVAVPKWSVKGQLPGAASLQHPATQP
jgi:septum formation protein